MHGPKSNNSAIITQLLCKLCTVGVILCAIWLPVCCVHGICQLKEETTMPLDSLFLVLGLGNTKKYASMTFYFNCFWYYFNSDMLELSQVECVMIVSQV